MAIDDLTDEAFFEAYQKNPQVKNIVDSIQKKYHVHHSQKNEPDYNEDNTPMATKEAKETIKNLLSQQKQDGKEKTTSASASGIFSGRMGYAAGLATVLIAVALASSGIPYIPPPLY